MTDINARIAVKKGWKHHECFECNHEHWQTPDGGISFNQTDPPQYTTDWRLAGELLEEMENVTLNHFDVIDWKWQCSCFYSKFSALADTPQMAICLAWLEWREG